MTGNSIGHCLLKNPYSYWSHKRIACRCGFALKTTPMTIPCKKQHFRLAALRGKSWFTITQMDFGTVFHSIPVSEDSPITRPLMATVAWVISTSAGPTARRLPLAVFTRKGTCMRPFSTMQAARDMSDILAMDEKRHRQPLERVMYQ